MYVLVIEPVTVFISSLRWATLLGISAKQKKEKKEKKKQEEAHSNENGNTTWV